MPAGDELACEGCQNDEHFTYGELGVRFKLLLMKIPKKISRIEDVDGFILMIYGENVRKNFLASLKVDDDDRECQHDTK